MAKKNWHVAVTEWNKELVAERFLRSAGFEPFNPRCSSQHMRRGRRVTVVRPYVPGYIFVRFDPAREPWQDINRARGIRRLICNTPETPTRIRQSVMAELFERCDGQVVDACVLDEIALRHMPEGSRIRIMAGPLMGFEATVQLSTPQRLAALVTIFGRTTPLDLAPQDAEPI
jgi:transcriptional antiterminator RfaH